MIHDAVAVVTVAALGCVQAKHHLVPTMILAQALGEACDAALEQPLELLHHLLSLVHGVKTLDPKHDFHLHLQGQHVAKRLVLGIDQPSAVHDDSAKHECGLSALFHLIHLFLGPITHSRQDLGVQTKKVYPWGVSPRVSSRVQSPHVMSLHQSAPLVDSLNHVARSVWAHSTLFSCTGQDGELATIDYAVLSAHRHVVRNVKDPVAPADETRLEELRDWAKTLPWDHPVARSLDHEVHRRRMAGESYCFIFIARAWVSSYPPFFLIHRRVPGG